MIAFLKSDQVKRPELLDRPPAEEPSDLGVITSDLEDASLVLKRKSDGKAYQLVWKKQDVGKADRRRALPAGEYQLVGYRLARRDAEGHEWFLSGTGKIRNLKLHKGQTHELKLSDVIGMQCLALPREGQLQVQAMVHGEHHCGLSVWKDGQRIPIGYRIKDAAGMELATGTLKYG